MASIPYVAFSSSAYVSRTSPATVASIRGVLDPPGVSRSRVRKSQRRVLDAIAEEDAAGDIGRVEQSTTLGLARQVEEYIVSGREPKTARMCWAAMSAAI